jgi:hypothetical protein
MFLFHLTTHHSDRLTLCAKIYDFSKDNFNGFLDYTHPGHMKPVVAQKKLIEMENWPSCGAYNRA